MATYEKRFYFSGYLTLQAEALDRIEALRKMEKSVENGVTTEQMIEFIKTLDTMDFDNDVMPERVDGDYSHWNEEAEIVRRAENPEIEGREYPPDPYDEYPE